MKFQSQAILAFCAVKAIAADSCNFGITVEGLGNNDQPLRQTSDGALRVGDASLHVGSFSLGEGGILTDLSNRVCHVVPLLEKLLCSTTGTSTAHHFAIDCFGRLHDKTRGDGSNLAYACPVQSGINIGGLGIHIGIGDSNEGVFDILFSKKSDACLEVSLIADSCLPKCEETPECPVTLSGTPYVAPDILTHLNELQRDRPSMISYKNLLINETIVSSVNFIIPPSAAGKTCKLVGALPRHGSMETAEWTGQGTLRVGIADVPTFKNETFNTRSPAKNFVHWPIKEDTLTELDSMLCKAGQVVSYTIEAPDANDAVNALNAKVDFNPCALGTFVLIEDAKVV